MEGEEGCPWLRQVEVVNGVGVGGGSSSARARQRPRVTHLGGKSFDTRIQVSFKEAL